jgi:hypothetical protein
MQPQLEIQGLNIVLRGHFNPAIFHPSWFAAQKLIRHQEAEAAEIKIVHPNAAIFETEWLQIHVLQDRFQAITNQEPYYETLRDLVVGALDLLSHTPLRVMGINRGFHYRLESEEAWDAVGHRLAPKQDWENVLDSPGMLNLTMRGKRPDDLDGYIQVKVEPSGQVGFGVYVHVNDHYQLSSASETLGANKAMIILFEQWSESMQRSEEIAQKIVDLGAIK